MALIRETASERGSSERPQIREHDGRRRIDVTDLQTAGIESFVRSSIETDRVSLEHRGVRTYLVLEE